jgi:ribonucleotide reductase beta subunit family protein with ferritin-like domain
MNAALMCQYIEHVADNLLVMLGYPVLFGSANPFGFMELIGMNARTNFFEERASLYQRSDVMNTDRRNGGGTAANIDDGDGSVATEKDAFFTEDF